MLKLPNQKKIFETSSSKMKSFWKPFVLEIKTILAKTH